MTEEWVAMQVEREPLKEPSDVEDAVAPPLEDLHAVVEPLDKSACLPVLDIVRDLFHPPIARPKKALELSKPACMHPLVPGSHRALGPCLRIVALDQCRQVFPQVVGLLVLWRQGEDPLEQLPLLGRESCRALAKRPHRPLDLGVLGWGQCALEPLELLLAHRICAVAVGPRLSAISSMPITPRRSQAPQSTVRALQRSRMPSIVSSETLSLWAASETVELISMGKAQCSYAFVLGLRGSYHSHGCVVVWLPEQ